MSFLFDKKAKKAMRWIWAVLGILVIVSMVFLFSGGGGGVF